MQPTEIIALCTRLEPIARKHNYHVAWTGSSLYGMGDDYDVDILIYPHHSEKQKAADSLIACQKDLIDSFIGWTQLKPITKEDLEEYGSARLLQFRTENNKVDLIFITNENTK